MKIPKIGITTKVLGAGPSYWSKQIKNSDFDVIEIDRKNSRFVYDFNWFNLIKKQLRNVSLSMHTITKRIFQYKEKELTLAQLEMLKLEILACKHLGAKELILHLKQEKLNSSESKLFREIIKFANKNKVELLYEGNKGFKGDTCLDFLKRFPDINMNLDLGHLNIADKSKNLGYDLDDFLDKIKGRVVYIHAHNNDGKDDWHAPLSAGNLDCKHVLDKLNMNKIKKIVIEQGDWKNINITKKDLDAYFKSRSKK